MRLKNYGLTDGLTWPAHMSVAPNPTHPRLTAMSALPAPPLLLEGRPASSPGEPAPTQPRPTTDLKRA